MGHELSAWPAPHDPEHLFTKALLLHGPLPQKGWSVRRGLGGEATYVLPRNKETHRFVNEVIDMFAGEVRQRYAARAWTAYHCIRVGQSWKNEFLRWVWEKLDDDG